MTTPTTIWTYAHGKPGWKLFLDDLREAPPHEDYVVCRSSQEALAVIRAHGLPAFMSLDHDLGGEDTTMVFLNKLVSKEENLWHPGMAAPDYKVHSQNPVGTANIISFMSSWKKNQ